MASPGLVATGYCYLYRKHCACLYAWYPWKYNVYKTKLQQNRHTIKRCKFPVESSRFYGRFSYPVRICVAKGSVLSMVRLDAILLMGRSRSAYCFTRTVIRITWYICPDSEGMPTCSRPKEAHRKIQDTVKEEEVSSRSRSK